MKLRKRLKKVEDRQKAYQDHIVNGRLDGGAAQRRATGGYKKPYSHKK